MCLQHLAVLEAQSDRHIAVTAARQEASDLRESGEEVTRAREQQASGFDAE